jgi:muconolactone delta-isomerase
LWRLPESGWKMPLIATMIVGISSQLYRQARDRLEAQNRDLPRNLQAEASARTLQAQELEQAREIQQSLMSKQIPQVPGDDATLIAISALAPAADANGDQHLPAGTEMG